MSKFLKTCRRGLHILANRYYDKTAATGECRQCKNARDRGETLPPIDRTKCWAGLHPMPESANSRGQCHHCQIANQRKRQAKARKVASYLRSDTSRGYYGPTRGMWKAKRSGEFGDVIQEGPTVMQLEQTTR